MLVKPKFLFILHSPQQNAKRTKSGKMKSFVENNYVNHSCISTVLQPVENPCGKLCGECGKGLVFNRYFASLPCASTMWKSLYKPLHIPRPPPPQRMLRQWMFRGQTQRKSAEMLESPCNLSVKNRRSPSAPGNFCENPPNLSCRMILPLREILSVSIFHRR